MSADYTILIEHQDEDDAGWRCEVYDTRNGDSPCGDGDKILLFAEENVTLHYALSHADDAIKRDQKRIGGES